MPDSIIPLPPCAKDYLDESGLLRGDDLAAAEALYAQVGRDPRGRPSMFTDTQCVRLARFYSWGLSYHKLAERLRARGWRVGDGAVVNAVKRGRLLVEVKVELAELRKNYEEKYEIR